jgi:hypothetical protein
LPDERGGETMVIFENTTKYIKNTFFAMPPFEIRRGGSANHGLAKVIFGAIS